MKLAILFALTLSACAQKIVPTLDLMERGKTAYRAGKFLDAEDQFGQAVKLHPDFPEARVYLGLSYLSQWFSTGAPPETANLAKLASEQFNAVLDADPTDESSIYALSQIAFRQGKFEEAADLHRRLLALSPENKDSYFMLGVIAATRFRPIDEEARAGAGLQATDPGPLKNAGSLRVKWLPVLDEGLQSLKLALTLEPQNADAMVYLSMLIRFRADLLDSSEEYRAQIATADEWLTKSNAARKPR